MGPELAVFRAIIELFWPTLCLAKMAILNTVEGRDGSGHFGCLSIKILNKNILGSLGRMNK